MPTAKYTRETCPHPSQREGENRSDLNTVFPNRKKAAAACETSPLRAGWLGPPSESKPSVYPSADKMLGQRVCLLSCLPSLHSPSWLTMPCLPSGRPRRSLQETRWPRPEATLPAQPPRARSGLSCAEGLLTSPSPQAHTPGALAQRSQGRTGTEARRRASEPHITSPEGRLAPAS